ncbi:hypothetical protein [Peristeroidobacter soli]|uniref:hypothetical protein n=1 Tax=Peristeroidobacter soli TaxID=2497877 RepID=UPI00101CD91F|nr:hypothetical protein [Peristeroidobacter soli]
MSVEGKVRQQRLAVLVATSLIIIPLAPKNAPAGVKGCESVTSSNLTVDHGHRWRPPFGLDLVGSPLVAHVEISSEQPTSAKYYFTIFHDDRPLKRQALELSVNPSDYAGFSSFLAEASRGKRFAHVSLPPAATSVVLESHCNERTEILQRREITRPELEADAVAHPLHLANPVDLGTILPPYKELLMRNGESATVDFAALSNSTHLPAARLVAWFQGDGKVEKPLPLRKGKRVTASLTLPLSSEATQTTLHIRLLDGKHQPLFSKEIGVMIAHLPRQPWPSFGAVETKLRYDAPIPSFDPQNGLPRRSISYQSAWDERLKDIVVFLPNGSRFVFWRGASYVPFWAGQHNTGTLYQWVENCNKELMVPHPDGSTDCPEPIFDSELRYGRVHIVESSASRVHVRWDYQLTDIHYEINGGSAVEDFYFYPDGFGTRVVTFVAPTDADPPQLSEFIVITPPSAYPLEVFPKYSIEAIELDSGQKERVSLPYSKTEPRDLESSRTQFSQLPLLGTTPTLYRVFSHKDDRSSAIYVHFNGRSELRVLAPYIFPPIYDRGEIVSPAYWGNHWPVTRGKWTGWTINDQISAGPAHSSLAVWIPIDPDSNKLRFEMAPLQQSQWEMPDCAAPPRLCNLNRFVWMIGNTDLSDADVIEMAKSYLHPPSITVTGGRPAVPAYTPERRALRVVAESSSITLDLNSPRAIINPTFEIDDAPSKLALITLDGTPLPANAYQWDGSILWIRTRIQTGKGKFDIQFIGDVRDHFQSP